jgi:hypothetical protein
MRNLLSAAALAAVAMSAPALAERQTSSRAKATATPTMQRAKVATPAASSVATTQANSNSAVQLSSAQSSASQAVGAGRRSRANRDSAPTPPAAMPIVSAAPSGNGSSVAIVAGQCDSLTDGDGSGCSFTGNINTNTNGISSFLLAQNAYNAQFDPDIALTPLFDADASAFITGGTTFIDNGDGTFTFNLADSLTLDFFAIKGGNGFQLFEYTGGSDNSFTFASNNLSHAVFFGSGMAGVVPEPATWTMMILGFGLAGSSIRRRRRAPVRTFA